MKAKNLRTIVCVIACAMLVACTFAVNAFAAETTPEQADLESTMPVNISQSGPLTIEKHLKARLGYPEAYYTVYIYAPSDVVGIQINNMNILWENSVILTGTVTETERGTGIFEPISVRVTLYYDDGSTYESYETIDVNHRCGTHPNSPNCTP